jgi:lysozyme
MLLRVFFTGIVWYNKKDISFRDRRECPLMNKMTRIAAILLGSAVAFGVAENTPKPAVLASVSVSASSPERFPVSAAQSVSPEAVWFPPASSLGESSSSEAEPVSEAPAGTPVVMTEEEIREVAEKVLTPEEEQKAAEEDPEREDLPPADKTGGDTVTVQPQETQPASSAVPAEPVSQPASSAASSEPVSQPASSAVSAEPVSQLASSAASSEPVSQPASSAVSAEPVSQPASSAASSEPVSQPASSAASSEPVSQPASSAASSKPVSQPVSAAPASSQAPSVPAAGWHTISGKQYYSNGTAFVTGWQTIGGRRYYFNAAGVKASVTCIDVSSWQDGSLDWNAIRADGVDCVMIRLGYRGYEYGSLNRDDLFETHYAGAKAAGLKIGVYFYSEALSEQEAADEATFIKDVLNGRALDLPVAFDTEDCSHRTAGLSRQTYTNICRAFCRKISSYGYTPQIYTYLSYSRNYLDMDQLSDLSMWIAQYGVADNQITGYSHPFDAWQYTSTAYVNGITDTDGDPACVDMSVVLTGGSANAAPVSSVISSAASSSGTGLFSSGVSHENPQSGS